VFERKTKLATLKDELAENCSILQSVQEAEDVEYGY
jgi:hypothetical protein